MAFCLTASLPAATVVFNGVLQGSQESPANSSLATGTVSLSIDSATLDWTLVGSFSGLAAGTTAAHIHGPAAPGVNATVLVPLTIPIGVTSGSLSGAGTLSAGNYANLSAGLLYVNIHNSAFPGGEIRAQLVPETSSAALGALACLGLLRRRRGV